MNNARDTDGQSAIVAGKVVPWTVVLSGLGFCEGPTVLPDGSICFSDEVNGQLLRTTQQGAKQVVCEVPGTYNGLALGPDGALYAADNGGMRPLPDGPGWGQIGDVDGHIARITLDGEISTYSGDLEGDGPHRLNDLAFDGEGRIYVTDSGNWEALFGGAGAQGRYRGGAIHACDPNGETRRVADVPDFPNGIVVAPDGQSLVVAHTTTSSLWTYPIEHGSLGAPELLADFSGIDGFGPDGLCLLNNGSILAAGPHADAIALVAPDGEIVELVSTPSGWGPTNLSLEPGRLWVTMGAGGMLCSLDVPWSPAVA